MSISDLLSTQRKNFQSSFSFVPSENYSFYKDFSDIYDTDIGNRYSFVNNPLFFDVFSGHDACHKIEKKVEDDMKELFQVDYISLNPLSGMHALTMVLASLTYAGDTIFTIPPECGGHSYTREIAQRFGLQVVDIAFDMETQQIDYKDLAKKLIEYKPQLIYIDQMTGIYNISLLPVEKYIGNSIAYYDISHNAAFIASGDHTHPLKNGYHAFGGSMHKSFPGPKKAIVATNFKDIFQEFTVGSKAFISHNSIQEIAILGRVVEIMKPKWKSYIKTIHEHVVCFSQEIEKLGFQIVAQKGRYSENHQVLFIHKGIDIKDFSRYLSASNIFVNTMLLPFTQGSLGMRMGFQEFSFLGAGEKERQLILKIFEDYISGNYSIEENKKKVLEYKTALDI